MQMTADGKAIKTARAEVKVLDPETGRFSAVVSTEAIDRDGDRILVSGWKNLDEFMQHPVILSSHNYHSLQNQIGEWESMKVVGKKLVGVGHFYIDQGNAEADWANVLAAKQRLAFSVGFIPDFEMATRIDEGDRFFGNYEFNGQELLEVSAVTIPANPQALQRLKGMAMADPTLLEIAEEVLAEDFPGKDADPEPTPDPDPEPTALSKLQELAVKVADHLQPKLEEFMATRIAEAIAEWKAEAEKGPDDEPSADDDEEDEDGYGDGDEPEAGLKPGEDEEFDPAAVVAQAIDEAVNEELEAQEAINGN